MEAWTSYIEVKKKNIQHFLKTCGGVSLLELFKNTKKNESTIYGFQDNQRRYNRAFQTLALLHQLCAARECETSKPC